MSDSYGNKIPYDGGEINREFYLEGYHQAEKDLALTWEDIRKILTYADFIELKLMIKGVEYDETMQEKYYEEILRRFNKQRNK